MLLVSDRFADLARLLQVQGLCRFGLAWQFRRELRSLLFRCGRWWSLLVGSPGALALCWSVWGPPRWVC